MILSKVIKKFKQHTMIQNECWDIVTDDNDCYFVAYHIVNCDLAIYKGEVHNVGELIHCEKIKIHDHELSKTVKQKLKFNGFTFQTEKAYDVDYENFKDNNTAEAFQHWWNEEGSLFTPEENEDPEEFMKRICGIAWNNGAFIQNK